MIQIKSRAIGLPAIDYAREHRSNATRRRAFGRRSGPICLGSGLVVLDVIHDNKSKHPLFLAGGSCCNVLTILAYLGWDSFPLARLGKDPEGARIVSDMEAWGVRTAFVERSSKISSPRIIERIHNDATPYHRFHLKCEHGVWLPRRRPLLLKYLQSIQDILPRPNVFYFDRAEPATLKAATTFKEQGSIIVFEPPSIVDSDIFARCVELADVVKHCYAPPSRNGRLRVDVPLEIQTRGAEGLVYRAGFLGNEDWVEMKAFSVPRLIDAAGSGDWLTAGLIHCLHGSGQGLASSEKELQHSLRFGQALASLNCGFVGARGAMYSLDRKHLLSATDRIISGGEPPRTPPTKSVPSIFSPSTCKACLCASVND